MNDTFWIRTRRGVEGPVSRERVVQLLARNQLGSFDEVSTDGRTWTRLRQSEFWGSPARATPARPAPEPVSAVGSGGAALRVSPDEPAPAWPVRFETTSRIRLESAAPRTRWRLPTADDEGPADRTVEAAAPGKKRAVCAAAAVCVVLAALAAVTAHRRDDGPAAGPDGADPVERSARGTDGGKPDPSAPSSPGGSDAAPVAGAAPSTEGAAEASAGSAAPSVSDANYPGEEFGFVNLGDYKPEFRPIVAYLTPSFQELRSTLQTVLDAPHVSENPLYSRATKQTRLYYFPELDVVNAFSSGYDENRAEGWPTVMVLGGAARFSRLVGAVIATENQTPRNDIARYSILFRELAERLDETACISLDDAWGIMTDCEVPRAAFRNDAWLPEAKRISMGIMLGIMSHEVGHLALGHVHGGSKSLQRTKNQEREADSFASSVGSGEWFAEPMFMGQLYFHFAQALNEPDGDNDTATDHPFSRERLLNLIRSNRVLAAKCGFTEDGMRKLLDSIHK